MSHVEIIDAGVVQEEKKEMVWPQLRLWEGETPARRVFFAHDLSITDKGAVNHYPMFGGKHSYYKPKQPDTQWQIKITAGDGSEFPRVVELEPYTHTWLILKQDGTFQDSSDETYMAVCLPSAPAKASVIEENPLWSWKPLPKGTVTTITVSEGKLSAEFEEPKPAFPYRLRLGAYLHETSPGEYQIRCGSGENTSPGYVRLGCLKQAVEYLENHND